MAFKLAESREEFDKAPAEFGGFIEKRLKRRVDMIINGKLLTMNTHGIVIKRSILDCGKTWYSYVGKTDFDMGSLRNEMTWVESHARGKDHIGLIFK